MLLKFLHLIRKLSSPLVHDKLARIFNLLRRNQVFNLIKSWLTLNQHSVLSPVLHLGFSHSRGFLANTYSHIPTLQSSIDFHFSIFSFFLQCSLQLISHCEVFKMHPAKTVICHFRFHVLCSFNFWNRFY